MTVSNEDRTAALDAIVLGVDWAGLLYPPDGRDTTLTLRELAKQALTALIAHGWGPTPAVRQDDVAAVLMTDLGKQIRDALHQHAAALYEATDPTLSPWPDDPDGSTLRFAGAIRAVLDRCDWWEGSSWFTPDRIREAIAKALDVPMEES